MSGSFEGFDPDAVALLDRLPNWSAEQYEARKAALVAGLVGPARSFVAEVADRLDADLTTTARGSVSPLHRDLRFASAGAPRYKDHLLMTMWEGPDKRTSPVLWVRVDAHRIGFASGIAFDGTIRDRWRAAVADGAGAELVDALDRLRSGSAAEVAGESLKRVPAGFDRDHPRGDLLRLQGFQVRFVEPLPPETSTAELVGWTVGRLERLLPVHRWMCRHVRPRTGGRNPNE
ncbi:MAG: DUF2461 family protein [Ilumatobacter fluminis]|uniref:DUF2461 family protein n=1 Tax=Ilumatobacter fluminis TaxID=467091 RepID=UPI0032ED778C